MALSTISGTTGITDATITSAKLADFAAAVDLNGVELLLDADQDTSITADTDDRIDFKIAGVEHFSFSNSSGDTILKPMVDAKDIVFHQFDGNKLFCIDDGNFVSVGGNATAPGEIRIYEDTDNGSHYTGFKAGNNTASVAYVLPTADGTDGFQLTTDGSGTLSWSSAGTTLANDGNNRVVTGTGSGLNGEANLTFDGSTLAVTGAATVSGNLTGSGTVQGTTITATTAFVPDASDGAALGTSSLEFSDLFLADAAVISLGDDDDVTITHVHDTGILINSTNVIQFNDASQNIGAPSNAILDINATDEIELNATLVDVNANLDVSGTITSGGVITGTAFTAGSAVLAEAELELLDGLTAGTAIASKVVTTDANIDTTGQRNLTISGELDAATGDFSGVVDIAGATTTAAITASGIIKTDDATDATSTTDGSLQTDGGLSVVKDVILGNDLKLLSDSAVLVFGAGSDATLTHTNDTGLTLNSTNKLMFNDASQFIQGSSATVLSIGATDEIDLTATAVDLNGTLNVSGVATFQATPVFPDGSLAVADLDIDGATDIGAAIVDADLFIIDDGAGGTNRKVTASRLKTYAGFEPDAAQVFNESSADVDFRVESNGNTHMLFVDGGNDHVMIGTSSDLGGVFGVNGDQENQGNFKIKHTGDAQRILRLDANRGAGGDSIGDIEFMWNGNINAKISGIAGPDTTNKDDAHLDFFTRTSGASIAQALRLETSQNATFFGNIIVGDDKGITFGDGSDWHLAAAAGESTLDIFNGSDNTPHANDGKIQFSVGQSDQDNFIKIQGGEGNTNLATLYLYGDQGDDSDDQWFPQSHSGSLSFDNNLNTIRQNLVFDGNGNGYADATWQDNSYDYAELFEWKTHLSNDSDINALWGKTVVLDGNKVKLAEDGDEANVIGIVRPKGSTNSHGDGLQWGGKWKKDVWGNYETENYTRVTWQENGYRHSYPKDRIPTHRLKLGIGEDKDIHKKESSFDLDKEGNKIAVVVPSTAEEKTATNYLERTHKKGKADVPLTRRIYNDSYNPATVYSRREDRLKEWVLIGMLGQVPVRDSTIIPTHWKKMKNLESGIDKYFIFNK